MTRRGADARLARLLHVLPAASRDGGASLSDLAVDLATSREQIVDDLDELTKRVFYRPGGWPDDMQILLDGDRVRVLHAAAFKRPPKLTTNETLCLAVALRGSSAASHLGDPAAREALLRRAESHLARTPDQEREPREPPFVIGDYAPDEGEHRTTLLRAARDRVACGIMYLKPRAQEPEGRLIHPYALVHAEGSWYVVAHCCVREAMRVFRVDRVLEAAPSDVSFEVPAGFDITEYVASGVYRAAADDEVRIRYSPRIARWIRERASLGMISMTEEPDGSIVLCHRVADPHWAVTQVLQYGADAEVLEPSGVRAMVRDIALKLA